MATVDSRIVVARSATGPGKSFMAADLAVWFSVCFEESMVYIMAAPPQENIKNVFQHIRRAFKENPELLPAGGAILQTQVKFPDGREINGVTIPADADPAALQASMSGKHAPHQLFIADEADNIPMPAFKAVDGCMSGDHERLLMLFNPRAQIGYPYLLEAKGEAKIIEISALNHPNVITGKSIYPGACSRRITIQRIHEWTAPLRPGEPQDSNCFEVPEYLVGVTYTDQWRFPPLPSGWRKVVDPQFSYKVRGKYHYGSDSAHVYDHGYLMSIHEELMKTDSSGQPIHAPVEVISPGQGQLHGTLEIYYQPLRSASYVLGADVSGGQEADAAGNKDSDYSTFDIYDRETMDHAASYWGREGCQPTVFAGDIAAVAGHFNDALVVVESNPGGNGNVVINELQEVHRYPNLYQRKVAYKNIHGLMAEDTKVGYQTTSATKPIADGYLGKLILEAARKIGPWECNNPRAVLELANYGKLGGKKTGALIGHDDHVRSLALCATILCENPLVRYDNFVPHDYRSGGRGG